MKSSFYEEVLPLDFLQFDCEMPHDREFLGNPVTAGDAFAAVVNVLQGCRYVIHVVVCVNPAWDCESEQLKTRITVLFRVRVAVGEQSTDFHAPYTGFEVKLDGECLCLEFFFRYVGQDFLRINEDCVSAGRSLIRD